jgi:hypothetical protein
MAMISLTGLFGVLEYNPIGKPIQLAYEGHVMLKTALWVPFLFGFAGFLMSAIVLSLDSALNTNEDVRSPSWPKVLYGISLFSGQYYLSGLLDNSLVDSAQIDVVLKSIAVIGFLLLDRSRAGFALAAATAIGGPLAEIFLINVPNLYSYVHPDIFGIPIWIGWVYFLGAPAVGNLARRLLLDKVTTLS